jgi:hypothetical protein
MNILSLQRQLTCPRGQSLSRRFAQNWTPAALGSALALWLDADDASGIVLNGSTVSQWWDKSGNGRNVAQTVAAEQPTYDATGLNGRPTLRFNSPTAGRHLRSTANFPSMTSGVSAIVVAQIDVSANWNGYVGVGALVANTSNFEFYRQGGNNSGNLVTASNRDQPGGNPNFRFANHADSPPPASQPHIAATVVAGATGTNLDQRVNGGDRLPISVEHTSGTLIPQATGVIRVGIGFFSGDYAVSSMHGRISEIVMSPVPWSTTNRQLLEGYLAWKWGLQGNLPANHPFRNSPPTV